MLICIYVYSCETVDFLPARQTNKQINQTNQIKCQVKLKHANTRHLYTYNRELLHIFKKVHLKAVLTCTYSHFKCFIGLYLRGHGEHYSDVQQGMWDKVQKNKKCTPEFIHSECEASAVWARQLKWALGMFQSSGFWRVRFPLCAAILILLLSKKLKEKRGNTVLKTQQLNFLI